MKKGVVCQEEKIARNGVFSQDILTGIKRFRSGMRMTQDRISILTRRQKGFFYPLLYTNQSLIYQRSINRSAQIGIHRVIRLSIGGIRG